MKNLSCNELCQDLLRSYHQFFYRSHALRGNCFARSCGLCVDDGASRGIPTQSVGTIRIFARGNIFEMQYEVKTKSNEKISHQQSHRNDPGDYSRGDQQLAFLEQAAQLGDFFRVGQFAG